MLKIMLKIQTQEKKNNNKTTVQFKFLIIVTKLVTSSLDHYLTNGRLWLPIVITLLT